MAARPWTGKTCELCKKVPAICQLSITLVDEVKLLACKECRSELVEGILKDCPSSCLSHKSAVDGSLTHYGNPFHHKSK